MSDQSRHVAVPSTVREEGSPILNGIKSVFKLGKMKGDSPLPENESVQGEKVVTLRKGLAKNQVREGKF